MLHSRAAVYFDEVAKRGSIRKAADHLHIAASAIDRQILRLEEDVGAPLFERSASGMRLTAAGELLVDTIRRSRRDGRRVKSLIDDLQGLRRGTVTIAFAEGATSLLTRTLANFRTDFPGIACNLIQASAADVVDLVLSSECDLGLTFNPPSLQSLRIEKTVTYRLGLVVKHDHRFASRAEIALAECVDENVILPDPSLSLRSVVDEAWHRALGSLPPSAYYANSIAVMTSLVESGAGVALLTQTEVLRTGDNGKLVFVALSDNNVPLSVMTLISQSVRLMSVPASMLERALLREMDGLPSLTDGD